MENVAFNEQFNVLTEDPHTAFYILTPQFMEIILSARERAYDKKHMCFTGEHLHIAIDTESDFFEARRSVVALKARVQNEIDYIKNIIDEFLLNERLFNPREATHRIPSERSDFKPSQAKLMKKKIRKVFSILFVIWSITSIPTLILFFAGFEDTLLDFIDSLNRPLHDILGVIALSSFGWLIAAVILLIIWVRRKLIKATMNLDI